MRTVYRFNLIVLNNTPQSCARDDAFEVAKVSKTLYTS